MTITGPGHLRDGPALFVAAIACGALLMRQRLPWTALLISTVAAEIYLARFQNRNAMLILAAPLFALYTVAELSRRRRALVAAGVVVLAVGVVHTWGVPSRLLGPENLALVALSGLAVTGGSAARHRRGGPTAGGGPAAGARRGRRHRAP